MRRTILAAAAVAAVFALASPVQRAAAMPIATPGQLGPPAATTLVQKAAVVCGYYGCRRVWPRYYRPYYRPYYGWHRPYWHRRWHRW
ncbi:MAG TPA: hypothetical protein VMC05_05105 [Xanthobacteraceae bacterium]|nr:hypothetical protein [Xanthobacteraceae bacterium]